MLQYIMTMKAVNLTDSYEKLKTGKQKNRFSVNIKRYISSTEEIKKRQQEYTEELYKKGLNDPDNHDGMITHLKPDILKCEDKWVLGSITTKLVEVTEF